MQFTTASTKFGVAATLLMALAVNGVAATKSTSTGADRKYSPSSKLYTPSLRRLQTSDTEPIVGSTPETCGCTESNANSGGLGFLELLYTGSLGHLTTIKDSMTVFDNRKGGSLLYEAGSVTGSWREDSAGLNYFRFEYPTNGKKVTQTAFHFCLDANNEGEDPGPCSVTQVAQGDTPSVCGDSLIFDNDPIFSEKYCYFWDVHTSCSTYLIGEAIMFDVPNFEIVGWGDRNAEPQRICEFFTCIILY